MQQARRYLLFLSLCGFGHNFAEKDAIFKVFSLFRRPANKGRRFDIPCPPGKVLLAMKNGEARLSSSSPLSPWLILKQSSVAHANTNPIPSSSIARSLNVLHIKLLS